MTLWKSPFIILSQIDVNITFIVLLTQVVQSDRPHSTQEKPSLEDHVPLGHVLHDRDPTAFCELGKLSAEKNKNSKVLIGHEYV